MTETAIRTAQVQVPNGDLQIAAYLAEPSIAPASTATFPALIVLQEIFGVNAHIRDVVDRFAQAGYVAIAPALYQRLAPGYESGYSPEEIKQGRLYKDQTQAIELLSDIQSAVNYLHTLPSVKPGAIGCIGFCFGGHVAYLAATLPDLKATASFYGAGIPTFTPGGGEPTIDRTAEIQGTLYAFFGMEDTSIPPAHVAQIEAELQKYQIPHKIFCYAGAEHGFFCDRRPVYHLTAAADAWIQVQALFSKL